MQQFQSFCSRVPVLLTFGRCELDLYPKKFMFSWKNHFKNGKFVTLKNLRMLPRNNFTQFPALKQWNLRNLSSSMWPFTFPGQIYWDTYLAVFAFFPPVQCWEDYKRFSTLSREKDSLLQAVKNLKLYVLGGSLLVRAWMKSFYVTIQINAL